MGPESFFDQWMGMGWPEMEEGEERGLTESWMRGRN